MCTILSAMSGLLSNVNDIRGWSSANLCCCWLVHGVFLANMVFLPIAGKLKRRSENEIMLKSIVLEGIISIHGREHPILIKEKLMTFVAMSERNALEEKEK